jgi:hypothetical protein
MQSTHRVLLLISLLSFGSAYAVDSEPKPKNVEATAGADVIFNAGTGDTGALGGQVSGRLEARDVPISGGIPLTAQGSLGRVGKELVGSGYVHFGQAPAPMKSAPSLALRMGGEAGPQISRFDVLPGLNVSNGRASLTISGRIPYIGGVISDRNSGTGFMATGVRFEALSNVSKVFQSHASAEANYLFDGSQMDDGSKAENGLHLQLGAGFAAKVCDHVAIKADGVIEGLNYRATNEAGTSSREANAITGTVGVAGAF